jgi:MFS family permease
MTQIVIGFLLAQVGWAFYSGAAEALAFDSLKEHGEEEKFDKVMSISTTITTISGVFAALVGIPLYAFYFRSTHLMIGVVYLLGLLAAFFLREPKIDTEKFSASGYLKQLAQGFHELLQPKLARFLLLIFVLLGIYFMYSYGFLKPAMAEDFGFLARGQGFLMAGMGIFSAVIVQGIPWMRQKLSDSTGLIILTALLGGGLIVSALVKGLAGLLPFTMITAAGVLASPWVSVVVNHEIASQYRATTLSTISMFTKIPYILAAIVAGDLVQHG